MADIHLTAADLAHLDRARRLAHAGWGRVHPNPMVGCVVVRDGEVVGEGWHEEFGGPHAEVVALAAAGGAAEGATAYVSLEPCAHHGKTPPCTDALRQAGIRRVVFGAADPGAESGGGGGILTAAGLEVDGPVWDPDVAYAENPFFFHDARHERPFVALKLALTLDGRIAGAPGERMRITGPEAERRVHQLRTGFDAIVVGAGTARADDPRLTVRVAPPGRIPPRRLVLASNADLSSEAALFEEAATVPLHVFTRRDAPEGELERLERAGAHVHPVAHHEGLLDLDEVLRVCSELGIRTLLCEGGARLASSLVVAGRVDRLYLFVAPKAAGPRGVSAFDDRTGRASWDDFVQVGEPEVVGGDVLFVLDRKN